MYGGKNKKIYLKIKYVSCIDETIHTVCLQINLTEDYLYAGVNFPRGILRYHNDSERSKDLL